MCNKISFIFILCILCLSNSWNIVLADDGTARLKKQSEEALQNVGEDTLEPNEIKTIEFRRHIMGQPGLQFYVVFFSDMGQPVEYFVTDGKCTSSRKRLLKSWEKVTGNISQGSKGASLYGDFFLPAPSLDGTHGESDEYIYCKTADGKYKQWNGPYYLSNTPIELTIKPLVVNLSGMIQSQN